MYSAKQRWLVLFLGLSGFGCSKQEAQPASDKSAPSVSAPTPEVAAANPSAAAAPSGAVEARRIFKLRCSVCHGEDGKGNGPGAAALNPKPRDYTDAEWQKSVTDENLKKVIVSGGAAVGKSPIMPPNPDLESKPEVVEGLVKIIRSFASK